MDDERTLLVVGDDARTRAVAEILRERDGYAIASVSPGDPTTADLEPTAALVGTDAGAVGVEAVRDRHPAVPVVALHDEPSEVAETLAAGATHTVRLRSGGSRNTAVVSLAVDARDAADEVVAAFDAATGSAGFDTEESATRADPRVPDRSAGPADGLPTPIEEFLPAAVDRLPDLFYVYEPDGTMVSWNARLAEVTGYDPEAIGGMKPTAFIAPTDRDRIATEIGRTVETGRTQATADLLTAEGEEIPYEFTGVVLETNDGRTVIAGTGRDVTERHRRERILKRQADRLETLNHINVVIRQVNEALVRTETREEIETAVCERLADAEPYRFVWIGEFDRTGEGVVPRAHAGEGEAYLVERAEAPSEWATAAAAMRDGEVKVVERMVAGEEKAPWHEEAVEHGHHSAAGIPITYRGRTYGVLCVYAPRPDAFDAHERTVLRELGETIGYAISAAERRHALLSDTVTEVELSVAAPGPIFVNASAAIDDSVEVDGVVEASDGIAEFLRLPTARVDDLRSHAADAGLDLRVMAEHDEESVVRVRAGDRSLAALAADHGGTLTGGTAGGGQGTATVEVPTGASVRDLVDRLDDAYDGDVSMRAQREGEPIGVSGIRFRQAIDDALTARQREVVETAYHAGFFEWPRGSTAEEVADLLGIAAPTFHEHLRHVQRKLVAAYLNGDQTS